MFNVKVLIEHFVHVSQWLTSVRPSAYTERSHALFRFVEAPMMMRMPIPELVRHTAAKQIQDYCERRVPAHVRHQVRLESITDRNTITIVERRAPWCPEHGPEWSSQGMVRFRYEPRLGAWRLFWSDRHGRWHRYNFAEPSLDVGELLAEVDRDPTSIFWG